MKGLEQEILLSETTIKNLRDQDLIQKTEEQKKKKKQKENEQNLKQTSQNYFREVFSAIVEAKNLELLFTSSRKNMKMITPLLSEQTVFL